MLPRLFILASLLLPFFLLPSNPQPAPYEYVGENFLFAPTGQQASMAGKPGIAFDGTNFLVVYHVSKLEGDHAYDIYAARISPDGVVLDPQGIPISTVVNDDPYPSSQYTPSVAFDGTNYMVVWVEGRMSTTEPVELQYDLYAARVTPAGQVLDPDGVKISNTHKPEFGAYYIPIRMPSIAFDGTNYLVVWRTAMDRIRGMRLSPQVAPLDGEAGFLINNESSFYPSVAFDGENYMVVWHDTRTTVGGWSIYGALVSPAGETSEPADFLINDTPLHQEHSTIEFGGTNYLVAWHEWPTDGVKQVGQVSAARVTPQGVVLDDPAILIYPYVYGEDRPSVTWDGAQFLVSWLSMSSSAHFRHADSYGVRLGADGSFLDDKPIPLGVATAHQWRPYSAYGAGRILVLWNEIHTRCPNCIGGQLLQRSNAPLLASRLPLVQPLSAQQAPDAGAQVAPPDRFMVDDPPQVEASPWISQTLGSNDLLDVWGVSAGDVYTSAMWGDTFHRDESGWIMEHHVPGELSQFGGWAGNAAEVWSAGWCWAFEHADGGVWSDLGCHGYGHGMALWGTPGTPLLGVGTQGSYQRYQNGDWIGNWSPEKSDLWDVWGSSATNIYAVGEWGKIVHYDGASWSRVGGVPVTQALNGIWGSAAQDIFAVGDFGTILHFDGASWTQMPTPTQELLFGVWGYSPTDVYAVGLHGTILHYDGASWALEDSGTSADLSAVWGAVDWTSSGYRVWAVGEGGVVLEKSVAVEMNDVFLPLVRGK